MGNGYEATGTSENLEEARVEPTVEVMRKSGTDSGGHEKEWNRQWRS